MIGTINAIILIIIVALVNDGCALWTGGFGSIRRISRQRSKSQQVAVAPLRVPYVLTLERSNVGTLVIW